jgi:hypothetical protein
VRAEAAVDEIRIKRFIAGEPMKPATNTFFRLA